MINALARLKTLLNGHTAGNITPTKTYSSSEVAELLGMSERSVRRACETGKFKAALTKTWRISGQSLLDFRRGEK